VAARYKGKKNIKIVEKKPTLQNDKITSKCNYETISPKTHSQMIKELKLTSKSKIL
jgi:hypothetical protein